MSTSPNPSAPSRRQFFRSAFGAAGGLVLGLSFERGLRAVTLSPERPLPADFEPNAFLKIGSDGSIRLFAKHDEMGQGIHTGLAIAVCEELEVDVDRIEIVPAPADAAFAHSAYGMQMTGGSTSTWSSFEQMRQVGATARDMLVRAAAARFGVEPGACRADNGTVVCGDRSASYAELAEAAAELEPAQDVPLKKAATFTRIGKPTPRYDSPAKVRGTAIFGMDRRLPGQLTAVVARSPYFGGSVKSFDATRAKAIEGVVAVLQVPSGVAVLARGFWPAKQGRDALAVEWNAGPAADLDSDRIQADYVALAKTSGLVARDDGDAAGAIERASKRLDAVYVVPYMAHAPMEPLNALVELKDDGGARILTGSQFVGVDQMLAAQRLGCDASKIEIQNSFLGGGFGRRANPNSDFVQEALEIALAKRDDASLPDDVRAAPVQTIWTREDDLRGGWYRPLWVNAIRVGLADGKIAGWNHTIVGQSIATGTAFESAMVKDGIDGTSVEGAADMPHGIADLHVELHSPKQPVPVQWWRSVGHSNTAFAKESMLDECAEALGKDPYELRRELLQGHDRLLRVLDVVADKAGWSDAPPAGVGRGISVHESFKGFAAHVVEASIVDGRPKVHRVVAAIDCGQVVNPDQVESQMQGAAIFALASAIDAGLTIKNGQVVESNFHDFRLTRMHEAPSVEVHIVDSDEEMGGIGEVGVPGVASALCSALRAAGGKRVRALPIGDQLA